MTEKILDFITFPKTFDNYKWYKPLLVIVVGFIIMLLIQVVITLVFYGAFGSNFIMSIAHGGYEVLNTEMGQIFTDLGVIALIPSLYIASRLVKDRPFSSYSSSRGGWNYKLYFKALIIPLILHVIVQGADAALKGPQGVNHFSVLFLIICLILVPLQCIAEEYVFRGLLMQTFGSWFNIPILALVIQAIIFAVVHGYNSLGIFAVFISGLIFGFFAWKTNGIEVSSALHTANNLILSLFVMFGIHSSTSSPGLNDVVISIVFQLILCAIMYFVGKKTNWFGEIEES
ncbi:MAG: CPBP family intramembrane metalloprotease [Methanobrevibacter sp.]|uniref:CPBP family intramembrane glutamic endopeptidase n=1 Tax=Methanobrevibacter sp. TaxID=66852 RepID=UPI0025F3F73E|nr:type II CAAX endopeptidase family protein [Methanobrevibacter sp.]MBQ6099998.1 CPBP family intramembrane metalloprotease [Methanobrevibacter sp.]